MTAKFCLISKYFLGVTKEKLRFFILLRTLRPDANYAMAGVERGRLRYIVGERGGIRAK